MQILRGLSKTQCGSCGIIPLKWSGVKIVIEVNWYRNGLRLHANIIALLFGIHVLSKMWRSNRDWWWCWSISSMRTGKCTHSLNRLFTHWLTRYSVTHSVNHQNFACTTRKHVKFWRNADKKKLNSHFHSGTKKKLNSTLLQKIQNHLEQARSWRIFQDWTSWNDSMWQHKNCCEVICELYLQPPSTEIPGDREMEEWSFQLAQQILLVTRSCAHQWTSPKLLVSLSCVCFWS